MSLGKLSVRAGLDSGHLSGPANERFASLPIYQFDWGMESKPHLRETPNTKGKFEKQNLSLVEWNLLIKRETP